jgi:NAD(P)-dependent dehydrogenase (short-subunit alcohol dehydrogenase family)
MRFGRGAAAATGEASMSYLDSLFSLQGRVALVTGASSGLGRHFALTLARAGATVAVAARREEALRDLVAQIRAAGGKALGVPLDVTDRSSVARALDAVGRDLGEPHVLINNAGVGDIKPPLEYTDEDWDRIVGTNLRGAWVVAQEYARRLVSAGQPGNIVNITSILASRVTGRVSPYAAAKAGLKHLTEALALELARSDIRVNSLAPGYVVTEATRSFFSSPAGEKLRQRIPTRRIGECADLDGPLLLLASDASRHMTGSEVVVDAGHLCSGL